MIAELIASLRSPESAPDLLDLLDDPEAEVRISALGALSVLRHAPALPRVLEALDDPDAFVRVAAVRALGRLGGPMQVPLLVDRLRAGHEPLALAAATSLHLLDPERGRAALLAFLDTGPRSAVPGAMRAVVASGDPVLVERVVSFVTHRDPELRQQALYDAGTLHLRPALPGILRVLSSDDVGDVYAALSSLRAIGEAAAVPALKGLLRSSPWNSVRQNAAETLASCGDDEGVPLILRNPAMFISLNALRRPGLWRRLNDIPVALRQEGGIRADLRALAEVAGLQLEFSAEAALIDFRGSPQEEESRPGFWTDKLEAVCESELIPIVEEGRLRILSPPEARVFWEAWWDARRPR